MSTATLKKLIENGYPLLIECVQIQLCFQNILRRRLFHFFPLQCPYSECRNHAYMVTLLLVMPYPGC